MMAYKTQSFCSVLIQLNFPQAANRIAIQIPMPFKQIQMK